MQWSPKDIGTKVSVPDPIEGRVEGSIRGIRGNKNITTPLILVRVGRELKWFDAADVEEA